MPCFFCLTFIYFHRFFEFFIYIYIYIIFYIYIVIFSILCFDRPKVVEQIEFSIGSNKNHL